MSFMDTTTVADHFRRVLAGVDRDENNEIIFAKQKRLDISTGETYEGGWNPSNEEYLVSLGTLIIPYVVMFGVTLLVIALWFLIKCCKCCLRICRSKKEKEAKSYGKCQVFSVKMLTLACAIVAIVGTIVVMVCGSMAIEGIKSTGDDVLEEFNDTVDKLEAAVKSYTDGTNALLGRGKNVPNYQDSVDDALRELNKFQDDVETAKDTVWSAFGVLTIVIMAVCGVIIALVAFGFCGFLFNKSILVKMVMITFPPLLLLLWAVGGITFVGFKLAEDTCVTFEDSLALSDAEFIGSMVLQDNLFCNKTEGGIDEGVEEIHELIVTANEVITDVNNEITAFNNSPLNAGQDDVSLVPFMCERDSTGSNRNECGEGDVPAETATEGYLPVKCEGNNRQVCLRQGKPLTVDDYNELTLLAATTVAVRDALNVLIPLTTNCGFQKVLMRTLVGDNCDMLVTGLEGTFAGCTVAAAGMGLLLLTWLWSAQVMSIDVTRTMTRRGFEQTQGNEFFGGNANDQFLHASAPPESAMAK